MNNQMNTNTLKQFKDDLNILIKDSQLDINFTGDVLKDFKLIENSVTKLGPFVKKGYLNKVNLKEFPILENLISNFTDNNEYIKGHLTFESYKWLFNIVILALTKSLLEIELVLKEMETFNNEDFLIDVINLKKQLFQKLDPSIRKAIMKRGISIIQNINTGFDTEYVNENSKFNKLVSVQLAQNIVTYLKFPNIKPYEICEVNPLTNENYAIKLNKSFNYDLLQDIIRKLVIEIRYLSYGSLDNTIDKAIYSLMKLKDLQHYRTDDNIVFKLPYTLTRDKIVLGNSYSLQQFLIDANSLAEPDLLTSRDLLIKQLNSLFYKQSNSNFDFNININKMKSQTRQWLGNDSDRISVTLIKNNILIGHNTSADLSILSDFNDFKDQLDIVNNCFITLGKGFNYHKNNVVIRDTMLLAPAGQKSLAKLGNLYNLDKIKISNFNLTHMDEFLKTDPKAFEDYAIRDSHITLKHANWMETFYFNINNIGIPLTLSSLGNKFVKFKWFENNYGGYQIHHEYLLGEPSVAQTPLGLSLLGELGTKLSLYIKNYKGGRNESFMYGIDRVTKWFDYDLTSAYTSILYKAGHPNYAAATVLTEDSLKQLTKEEILNSYTIIKCFFKFPNWVKFPSIPVYVDETTTVYPLEGQAILTGAEYLLAKSQSCQLKIEEIYRVPFLFNVVKKVKNFVYPFKEIINEIQSKRREHPKGTISNLMYKEIGNSIYGSLVRGMGDKRKFDNKTGETRRLHAHYLTNPLIASWITGYIRSIIGECLHNVQQLNGKVASVTTDGFLTDISDLESKIISNSNLVSNLLQEFKEIRFLISGNSEGIELKHESTGLLSWCTRGQLGLSSDLRATTGFQNRTYSQKELADLFLPLLGNTNADNRNLEYIQTSLRSAIVISKYGGHVTRTFSDHRFSLNYDNRRFILDELNIVGPFIEVINCNNCNFNHPVNEFFFDSIPFNNSLECFNVRSITKSNRLGSYNRRTNFLTRNKYTNYTDLAIRNFVKGLIKNPLDSHFVEIANELNNYNSIIDFILSYKANYKISKSSISNLKSRKLIEKQVPRLPETVDFVDFVKIRFPNFDSDKFFNHIS